MLGDLAMDEGFALVLMQMAGGFWGVGSTWMNTTTGQVCSDDASSMNGVGEYSYAVGIMDALTSHSNIEADTAYPIGFSSGSICTSYTAMCLRTSTNYKVK